MHKALKKFTTILLSTFFLIVSINFVVIAQDTQGKSLVKSGQVCSIYNIQNEDITRAWLCGIIFLTCFLILIFYRDVLRSPGRQDVFFDEQTAKLESVNKLDKKNQKNPYSLSISQFAFWNVIIFGSYLVIYGLTEKYNGILSESAVFMLGINTGTTVFSSVIDGQNGIDEQKGTLRTTNGFWNDILSDFNGINFHRLQAVIWTIGIGFVFIFQVSKDCAMPNFDPPLIALQGISAGSYLAFRSKEVQQNKNKDTSSNINNPSNNEAVSVDASGSSETTLPKSLDNEKPKK